MEAACIYAGQVHWQEKKQPEVVKKPPAVRRVAERRKAERAEFIPAVPVVGHVTTEQTSKALKWRIVQALGLMGLGLFIMNGNSTLGSLVILAGGLFYLQTKVLIWWHHG